MGLAERRAIKDFETNKFPALKAQVIAALGYDLPIEVNWESLAIENSAHLYADSIPKVYFEPLVEAFKAICIDDMGKEALKGALKKIIIKGDGGKYSAPGCYTFAEGVLTFDHNSTSNVGNGRERATELQKMLEKVL
jgi:hypothetical protein